ncbi:MAG: type II toxin-antitoxin system HicB family antitoxin [Bacteroidales bacterium]|nr:type II toxin-antitoxin system HicB family antitoxin [Bacteroidales bacterium]
MKREFTAFIESATEGGFWAICPEIEGANGQGETVEEAKQNLKEAIKLILDDKLEDFRRGSTEEVIIDSVLVE